jgi:hypothetical protein
MFTPAERVLLRTSALVDWLKCHQSFEAHESLDPGPSFTAAQMLALLKAKKPMESRLRCIKIG